MPAVSRAVEKKRLDSDEGKKGKKEKRGGAGDWFGTPCLDAASDKPPFGFGRRGDGSEGVCLSRPMAIL